MSQRGRAFLHSWIFEHIGRNAYPMNDARAKVFAEECAADAAKAGITVSEIEEDMGDIDECILKALEEVTNQ
jgi:hypothetical protein